jgi:hypothetical protein
MNTWARRSENVHRHAGAFPDLETYLREELRYADISVFWHLGSRNWFAAVTREDPEPELCQVVALNHDPDCEDGPRVEPDTMGDLRATFLGCGVEPREAMRLVDASERARQVRLVEEDQQLLEHKRWLGRRMGSDNPWFGRCRPSR